MTYVYGHHKVRDFNVWKPFFEEDEPRRTAAGIKLLHLFQDVNDPNDVHFLFESQDLGSIQKMMESEDMEETMKKAGVLSEPHFHVLKSV